MRASSAPPPPPASVAPEAPAVQPVPEPPPSTPPSVRDMPKAYASEPPVIRERQRSELDADRIAMLELAAEELLEESPMALVRRSTPPPPPPPAELSPADAEPVSTIVTKKEPRPSAPDPTDILFDGLYELNFVDTPWQAADVCAATLAAAVGARAVVIHAHDLVRREIRAIGVFGPNAHEVLGAIEPSEDDFVAQAAICNQKPLSMRFEGELPRLAPKRLATVGAVRSLVAVPVLAWGRCVALIEVVDADDVHVERVTDSIAYVAERLAEFLRERAAA